MEKLPSLEKYTFTKKSKAPCCGNKTKILCIFFLFLYMIFCSAASQLTGPCYTFCRGFLGWLVAGVWGQSNILPSLKLTYPLKIDPWKRRFLLETIIFGGYVRFREGIFDETTQLASPPTSPRTSCVSGGVELAHLGGGVGGNGGFSGLPG